MLAWVRCLDVHFEIHSKFKNRRFLYYQANFKNVLYFRGERHICLTSVSVFVFIGT